MALRGSFVAIDNNDLYVVPRHDKRRHRVLRCPVCNKGPLRFLEESTDEWYLGEFDEDNRLVRHVCKMKKFGKSTR